MHKDDCDPFLNTGTMFAILKSLGTTPVEKEALKTISKGIAIVLCYNLHITQPKYFPIVIVSIALHIVVVKDVNPSKRRGSEYLYSTSFPLGSSSRNPLIRDVAKDLQY